MQFVLRHYLWFIGLPPLGLCLGILILLLITAGWCNPLYTSAPISPEDARQIGKADWADALSAVSPQSEPFAASRRRGKRLGVCASGLVLE